MEAIHPEKLQDYCRDTANLYVENYSWYPMPQAVHKLLIHSHQDVRVKELPIGMLSEEVQESSNKNFKNFRENFTRKNEEIALCLRSCDHLSEEKYAERERNEKSYLKSQRNCFAEFFIAFLKFLAPKTYKSIYNMYFAHIFAIFLHIHGP